MSHQHVVATTQPISKAPTTYPREWTMVSMRQHLQTAVLIELHTIPLYMFAAHSIKPGNNQDEVQTTVLDIAVQKTFHLGLVGNLLTALRGWPQVYGEAFTPKYPAEMLYEGVLTTLASANKYQIENFAEIEQPIPHEVNVQEGEKSSTSTRTLAQYDSIGQFYESLKKGLQELHRRLGDDIFDRNSVNRQWQGGPNTPLAPIIDLDTALKTLQHIIEQGEGGKNVPESESHYGKFTSLAKLELDVYPLASNPKTSQFEGRETSYPVMLAFDAAYSYLLWTIEAGWAYGGPDNNKRTKLKASLHTLLVDILSPIAKFLVQQELQTFKKNAAPPFNLYIFTSNSSPLQELQKLAEDAAKAYPNSSQLKGVVPKVKGLFDLGDI